MLGAPHSGPALSGASRASTARNVRLPYGLDPVALLGHSDHILRTIERGFPSVRIILDDRNILLTGPTADVSLVAALFSELIKMVTAGGVLDQGVVAQAIGLLRSQKSAETTPSLAFQGKTVRAKTPGQQKYLDALSDHQVTFAIGPAGTGKTYLAMAVAVQALLSGQVRRLVLTRPAVEAGETLGYLPGTLVEKINPYLRPLYDALHDLLEAESLPKLMEAGAIEVAPLAYMRGRTLNSAFVVLDEAQNTTPAQMKMLLTRLGKGSKLAVTGDVTQVDLGHGQVSGLTQAEEVLSDVAGINFTYLSSSDVVRTPIVADIVDAYEEWDAAQARLAGVRSPHPRRTSRRG